MTNICIQIGLASDASSLKTLSRLSYRQLRGFNIPSYYKLSAISRAAGILGARKKSLRRGHRTRDPFVRKALLTSCYGFKISDGNLHIPVGWRKSEVIPLNTHTNQVLSDSRLRACSFTLTPQSMSICISKEVKPIGNIVNVVGVDRNLNNLTVGNSTEVTCYDISKTTEITKTTTSVTRSFRRNDARIRRIISGKYGERRNNRVRQLLHQVSKQIVESALRNRQAIVFEDVRGIRRLYQKGNRQTGNYRGRMNSWPFHEAKRQIEYKAAWAGVPTITLTKPETRGTSQLCPKCGERLQSSRELKRKVWCKACLEMFDRDLVAVLNISRRGRLRFERSKGVGAEAMVQESNAGPAWPRVILKVDPTKLTQSHQPKS